MNSLPPTQVLHVITRLIVGGAQENTLYTAARLDPLRCKVEVICGPQTGSEGSLNEEAEADLSLDPKVSLAESHAVASDLKRRLESCFPEVKETALSFHPGNGWQKAS